MSEPTKAQLESDLRDAKTEIAKLNHELSLARPFVEFIQRLRNLETRIESLEYRVPEDFD